MQKVTEVRPVGREAHDAAVAELEHMARERGFRAMEIGTEVGEEQIADPKFRKILKRAAELNVFIFAHPFSWTPFCAGLGTHHLNNLIGNQSKVSCSLLC